MFKGYILIFIVLFVNSCYSNKYEHSRSKVKGGHYKIGSQYMIKGRKYIPKDYTHYNEIGVASWYGGDFHNKLTANGDVFNRHALTAAHRTLPLPSIVRVTNLENGRSIYVKINDRGPFSNDRILDVSERAAQVLGFSRNGTALVSIKYMDEYSRDMIRHNPTQAREYNLSHNNTREH